MGMEVVVRQFSLHRGVILGKQVDELVGNFVGVKVLDTVWRHLSQQQHKFDEFVHFRHILRKFTQGTHYEGKNFLAVKGKREFGSRDEETMWTLVCKNGHNFGEYQAICLPYSLLRVSQHTSNRVFLKAIFFTFGNQYF